ncbi:TIGR03986 family CRISPR-associated RAMP protein [Carboxydocella sp. ULO1]|uniref:TIGR03986 family type III CRISPR-associated RAMP protein n=1 Tax=Carboxydocella sp. ULO1 TaxID=1926599 RepID=UPI0009C4D788|nr:TIGR03986 family CRISPR-associated RAMP protein [Carboxydocella sp. ULO1]GAW27542.1 CRISPR-associated RAMP family protein [Carboxydocella sp. ULO1]
MKGTIKSVYPEKQIGFIRPDDGGNDVFFHLTWLKGVDPNKGMRVEFDIVQGEKGPRARNLRIIKESSCEYRFHNPYNFVRYLENRPDNHVLGNCLPPTHDRYVGLTGRITCKVEAVTPLFISDSHAVKEENGHKTYRFFQYEGRPALPASSLRGMIRSVFEAVTNSCFAVFQKDNFPLEYRISRAPENMIPVRVVKIDENGALLERMDCAASVIAGYPSKNKLPEGAKDGMRVAALVKQVRNGVYKATKVLPVNEHESLVGDEQYIKVYGWLHVTGPNIEIKRNERLFFRRDDKQPDPQQVEEIPNHCLLKCDDEVVKEYNNHLSGYWERLRKTVEKLGDQRWPNSTKDIPQPSTFVEKGRELRTGDLVYALCEDNGRHKTIKMLRPVCIPRIRYKYPRQKFLPKHFERCRDYNTLCPACRVFGWVHEKAGDKGTGERAAYAGRVRFSHGKIIGNYETEDKITLAILSAPKPTTTFFYLLDAAGQPDPTVTYDTEEARLRGRKFYRHHGEAKSEEYCSKEKSDQNRTVEGVLKPGATFTFTLDFENLHRLELGALLYALELEEGIFHRLGYAKPLRFGSVKVTVDKVEIIDWEKRLKSIEPYSGWQFVNGVPLKQDFLNKMRDYYGESRFNNLLDELRSLFSVQSDLPIHYPRPKERLDSNHPQYEWFVGNKRRIVIKRSGILPAPVALGLATEVERGLPLIKKNGK